MFTVSLRLNQTGETTPSVHHMVSLGCAPRVKIVVVKQQARDVTHLVGQPHRNIYSDAVHGTGIDRVPIASNVREFSDILNNLVIREDLYGR